MDIIQTWAQIKETGILPAGFRPEMVVWDRKGWKAYIAGPGGSTNWIWFDRFPEFARALIL